MYSRYYKLPGTISSESYGYVNIKFTRSEHTESVPNTVCASYAPAGHNPTEMAACRGPLAHAPSPVVPKKTSLIQEWCPQANIRSNLGGLQTTISTAL